MLHKGAGSKLISSIPGVVVVTTAGSSVDLLGSNTSCRTIKKNTYIHTHSHTNLLALGPGDRENQQSLALALKDH